MNAAMMAMGVVVGCAAGIAVGGVGDVYTGSASAGALIPDDSVAGVEVPIDVVAPMGAVVGSVTVEVEIAHDWVGDLVLVLRAPGGEEVVLLDRAGLPNAGGFPGAFGCGGRGIEARFVDGAMVSAEDTCSTTAVPVIAGDVRAAEELALLAGAGVDGEWVLVVSDRSAHDAGSVVGVTIVVDAAVPCPADLSGDGSVDFFDVSLLLQGSVDYNGDTLFDFFDISAFLQDLAVGCD